MSLPPPQPGLVIRYSYLWCDEARRGQEEGVKDRPCVVVLAVQKSNDILKVRVAPITHTPPHHTENAIEVPASTKKRLGLDDECSWIITKETNLFTWPGPDLRPVNDKQFTYGLLAQDLFHRLRDTIIANRKAGRSDIVRRTD